MELIKESLLAIERVVPFHFFNLAMMESAIGWSHFFFEAHLKMGIPKYLKGKDPNFIPEIDLSIVTREEETYLPKNIYDFTKFTCWPDNKP